MVEVVYKERLGNNLFQYCIGRIIAEGLGYKLKADPIPCFPKTSEILEGEDCSHAPRQVFSGQYIDIESILQDKTKRHIIIDGYFQRYEYYRPYKTKIKMWLATEPCTYGEDVSSRDAIICMRRDDSVWNMNALPLSYYEGALRGLSVHRFYICTDDIHDWYIKKVARVYHAKIMSLQPEQQIKFIMAFNNIIISQSSFQWWAAFLSKAEEIYFPIPLEGYWSDQQKYGIDVRVTEEKRYKYVRCIEKYKITSRDKIYSLYKRVKRRIGLLK